MELIILILSYNAKSKQQSKVKKILSELQANFYIKIEFLFHWFCFTNGFSSHDQFQRDSCYLDLPMLIVNFRVYYSPKSF